MEQLVFVDKVWEMEFANISSSVPCSAIYLEVLVNIKSTHLINICLLKTKILNYFDDKTEQILTFVESWLSWRNLTWNYLRFCNLSGAESTDKSSPSCESYRCDCKTIAQLWNSGTINRTALHCEVHQDAIKYRPKSKANSFTNKK
jgi:hypothetical protein